MNIPSISVSTAFEPSYSVETGEQGADTPLRASQNQPEGNSSLALSESELGELDRLQARDREVRAHEAAHQSVGGSHAGAASFTYQRGPDGVQYAVGGEVPIDISQVEGNPQATIDKMRVVHSAALAPAQPSSQDQAVAAEAMQILLQAQVELARNDSSSGGDAADESEPAGRAAVETYRTVAQSSDDQATAGGPAFQATA